MKLTGEGKESELVNRLSEQWQEFQTAKMEFAEKTKTADLKKLRNDLAVKERELQSKMQQREANIKAELKTIEAGEKATASRQAEESA